YCLIGATAMSVWGYARFTADIDLLTMDDRVLERSFWEPSGLVSTIGAIRRGDISDPLGGLVRFKPAPAVDVIVGRGAVMREAVQTAIVHPALGPIATPLMVALMKIEAGGIKDRWDVAQLLQARSRIEPGVDLAGLIELRVKTMSDWAQRAWARVKEVLAELESESSAAHWAAPSDTSDGADIDEPEV
ncbi:MAG TPA: hypothetical protein PK095_02805, partial [Myxococcota bacterium]|nr:hypothetical protein [Myxococcota bacterium]